MVDASDGNKSVRELCGQLNAPNPGVDAVFVAKKIQTALTPDAIEYVYEIFQARSSLGIPNVHRPPVPNWALPFEAEVLLTKAISEHARAGDAEILITLLASGSVCYYPSQRNVADAIANASAWPAGRDLFIEVLPELSALASPVQIGVDSVDVTGPGRLEKNVLRRLGNLFSQEPRLPATTETDWVESRRGEPAIYDGPTYGPSGLSRGDFTRTGRYHHPPEASAFMSGLAGNGRLRTRAAARRAGAQRLLL